MSNRTKIGNAITIYRVCRLLTTWELAEQCRVPHDVVVSIEEGRNGYTKEQLKTVWEFLNIK